MFTVFIRTVILYILVLIALRIMGKSELSKLSTFQMVVLFMIAELASIPMDSLSASLINGVTSIFTLTFLQVLLSFISMKWEKFRHLIDGNPSQLIKNGALNIREMQNQRITINELFEQLRLENCPLISDIESAVLESNGELSVIKKSDNESMPVIIISDGSFCNENLDKVGITSNAINDILFKKGMSSPREVFLAYYDNSKVLHIFPTPSGDESFTSEV